MSVHPMVKGEEIPEAEEVVGQGTWHTNHSFTILLAINFPSLLMPHFLMTSQVTHDYSLAHHSY